MPLRFPRRVTALLAASLAAWLALGSMPGRADQVRQQEWWLTKLSVLQAWRLSEGAGVTVAVLGDGVAPGQPDLAGSVRTARDFSHSGRAPGGPFYGLAGTAAASLIAGHGHGAGQSAGIVGVAPQARILAVRATLSSDDPLLSAAGIAALQPSDIALAIRYAVRHGAAVIDLPLDPGQSGAGRLGPAAAAGGGAAEIAAIDYALSRQVMLVAPAGDNGGGSDAVNYPAAYPGVISVGAFDQNFVRAAFSSRQPTVTLTAPGTGVIAAAASGGYAAISSTSAASAVVAGIAALIRARFPELSVAQVTSALTTGTVFRRPGGSSDGSGHGTANAARALAAAARIAAPLARPAAAGALPLASPVPTAVHGASASLARTLLRDAVISAGVLIILLLPIAAFGARRRRLARPDAAASVAWHPPGPAGYPPGRTGRPARRGAAPGPAGADRALDLLPAPALAPGISDADRMLELFSVPAGRPAWPPETAAIAGLRPPPGYGGVTVVRDGPASDGSDGTGTAGAEGAAASGQGADGDDTAAARGGANAPRPVLSAASRAAARPPKISGSPPWGPAPKPASALPWETAPPPAAISGRSAAAAAPMSAASSVWPGTPAPAAVAAPGGAPRRPPGPLWPAASAPSTAPPGAVPAAPLARPPAPQWPPAGAQPPAGHASSGPPAGHASSGPPSSPSPSSGPPSAGSPLSGPLWPPAAATGPPRAAAPGTASPRPSGPQWPAPAAGSSIWDAAGRGRPHRAPGQGGEAAGRRDSGGQGAAADPVASTETLPVVDHDDS